ncbi:MULTISPECIES: WYL domain-containing protein [Pseudomonas]|uniref:WYL domain-containing protein n=1 Tax=Pseudomonas asiatica TaxID=2219225 RepID=A0ABU5L5A9_9PSED|nr:WYL domain-containing protein [Pseudomonas asiatica]MBA6109690.1 WYL domain-containing protein [Pseudomonas asiatica]MDZ5741344.1 WYL domain-containing protein [Pseudomonas asiatica]MDZ5746413.1 WYL domain-containing protein [Pseudomonas asiatica]MDZ5751533.1 WYL domain-containing protein [Pseudomonas asiatica]MDZ5756196.1 WYL domain-containing protein [Pseudomonas asiatica]
MPSHPTRHTIARQWQLLKLLPGRHPGMSSTQLQAALTTVGYITSKRTVERDLVELAALFPLQCNSKGMPYGWYWQAGLNPGEAQQLQPDALSPAEQIELHAWVDDALARRLEASPLSAHMQLTLQTEGGAILVATVDDNRSLMGWLLSQAGSIRVQAPQALRQAMLVQLRQSLALHEGGC